MASTLLGNNLGQVVHTHVHTFLLTWQYNLLPAVTVSDWESTGSSSQVCMHLRTLLHSRAVRLETGYRHRPLRSSRITGLRLPLPFQCAYGRIYEQAYRLQGGARKPMGVER